MSGKTPNTLQKASTQTMVVRTPTLGNDVHTAVESEPEILKIIETKDSKTIASKKRKKKKSSVFSCVEGKAEQPIDLSSKEDKLMNVNSSIDSVKLDEKIKKQMLSEETLELNPVPFDLNPVSLDLNPVALDLNPVSLDLNPVTLDLNPVSLELNPVTLNLNPVTLNVNLESPDTSSSSKNMKVQLDICLDSKLVKQLCDDKFVPSDNVVNPDCTEVRDVHGCVSINVTLEILPVCRSSNDDSKTPPGPDVNEFTYSIDDTTAEDVAWQVYECKKKKNKNKKTEVNVESSRSTACRLQSRARAIGVKSYTRPPPTTVTPGTAAAVKKQCEVQSVYQTDRRRQPPPPPPRPEVPQAQLSSQHNDVCRPENTSREIERLVVLCLI